MNHLASVGVAVIVLLSGVPALAQTTTLNGDWGGTFHEDQPERGPGPELGDYLGIPLNAAGRQYADSWDASRLTLPEHQCRAHVSPYIYRGPIQVRITEVIDPGTQTVDRHQALPQHLRAGADHLARRPSASARGSAAHVDGILDRRVAGHRAEGLHDPSETGLAPAQRRADERQGHDDGILLPARQRPHADDHHRGSGVPQRAARQDHEPATERQRRPPTSTRPGSSARPTTKCRAATRPTCRTSCRARTPICKEFAEKHGLPVEPTRGGAETAYPEYAKKMPARRRARRRAP